MGSVTGGPSEAGVDLQKKLIGRSACSNVGFLSAISIVLEPDGIAHLIE